MSQTMKVVAALVFVTALGWVLLQPVFDAVEPDTTSGRDRPPRGASTERSATPADGAHEPEPLPDAFRIERLFEPFPDECLRRTSAVSDVIAVERGDHIAAGPLDGDLEESTAARLAGVSVSGRVAWHERGRGMALWNLQVNRVRPLPYARDLVWSPISPCALVPASDGSTLVVLPSRRPLVRADVRQVAFSPDGRRLALVLKEEQATSVWVASLSTARMREVLREQPTTRVDLRAWSPDARTIYLSVGAGDVLSFVAPLRTSAPSLTGRVAADPVEPLEPCGARLLGIFRGRIAEITTSGPQLLSPAGTRYRYLSCSPEGRFIAAIGSNGLVLLDANADFLRDLTDDTGYTDVFVDWGRTGAGLIFGRVRSDPDAAELWHIPEGAGARPTGITYRGGPDAVDWGASPPTGLP